MSNLRASLARQNARQEIDMERLRQVREEGWTPEHDDAHEDGQMLAAARCYYLNVTTGPLSLGQNGTPENWPWDKRWWKPKGYRRDLIRAGALCMAEQERAGRVGADIRPAAALLNQIVEGQHLVRPKAPSLRQIMGDKALSVTAGCPQPIQQGRVTCRDTASVVMSAPGS